MHVIHALTLIFFFSNPSAFANILVGSAAVVLKLLNNILDVVEVIVSTVLSII